MRKSLSSFDDIAKVLGPEPSDSQHLETFFVKAVNSKADVEKLLGHAHKIFGELTGELPAGSSQEAIDEMIKKSGMYQTTLKISKNPSLDSNGVVSSGKLGPQYHVHKLHNKDGQLLGSVQPNGNKWSVTHHADQDHTPLKKPMHFGDARYDSPKDALKEMHKFFTPEGTE